MKKETVDATLTFDMGKLTAIELSQDAAYWMVEKFLRLELLKETGKVADGTKTYRLDLVGAAYYDIYEHGMTVDYEYVERSVDFGEWWDEVGSAAGLVKVKVTQ